MINTIKTLLDLRIVRYIVVGISTIIVDIVVLAFFKEILQINLSVSASVAYWLSIAWNFSLNRWWTFSAQEYRSVIEHAFLYGSLLLFNYIYTVFAINILDNIVHYTIAKFVIIITATLWTYPIYRNYIFKNTQKSN